MNKLPDFILNDIVDLVSTDDLFNCRLVSKRFDYEVKRCFSKVTHVSLGVDEYGFTTDLSRINRFSAFGHTLYPPRKSITVRISGRQLGAFFTFLQEKCPNLQVLNAPTCVIPLEELSKISEKLVYLIIDDVKILDNANSNELKLLFPNLQAFIVRCDISPNNLFCLNHWSKEVEDAKHIRWSDFCCHEHRIPLTNIPAGILWYDLCHPESPEKLISPSVGNSLRVLMGFLKSSQPLIFDLPELLIARIVLVSNHGNMAINSLKNSRNLQVLEFKAQIEISGDTFCSLVSPLEHLRRLILRNETTTRPSLNLSLTSKLTYLELSKFGKVDFVQMQTPAQIRVFNGSNISTNFHFPYLVDSKVYTNAPHTPLTLRGIVESFKLSSNLKKLNVQLKFFPTPPSSWFSWIWELEKLECLVICTCERIDSKIWMSRYPRLRELQIICYSSQNIPLNDGHGKVVDIYFEEKYKSVEYNSDKWLKLKPFDKPSTVIKVEKGDNLHFKYPLESTVTKATFRVPLTNPSFSFPHLMHCQIIFYSRPEHQIDNATFSALAASFSQSPKLQEVTLLTETESAISLNQLLILLASFAQLEHLQEFNGRVITTEGFNFAFVVLKYPFLARIKCNCEFVNHSDV